jgi:YlmC/YmxH family sporulation protein
MLFKRNGGAHTVGGFHAATGNVTVCTSDLKLKDVVNVIDGKRLGAISDIEIDAESGNLTAIVVPGSGKFLGLFGRNDDMVIPWNRISKIGLDVILVEVNGFSDPKRDKEA